MSSEEKPVKEIRVYTSDKVPFGEDDLYDFRPQPLPADAEEEEVPKGSPVMAPVESSDSQSSEQQTPVTPASAPKGKSPAKTGS